MSSGRSSIAPHEQDEIRLDECFSGLVDILREILLYWIQTNPPHARIQVEAWWSTKMPLFRRFVAYAKS